MSIEKRLAETKVDAEETTPADTQPVGLSDRIDMIIDEKSRKKLRDEYKAEAAEINKRYDAKEAKVAKKQLLMNLARHVSQLVAAQQGMKTGVDMSGLKTEKPDVSAEMAGISKAREGELTGARRAREKLLGLVEKRSAAKGAGDKKWIQTMLDPNTKKPGVYMINSADPANPIKIGEKGYKSNVETDADGNKYLNVNGEMLPIKFDKTSADFVGYQSRDEMPSKLRTLFDKRHTEFMTNNKDTIKSMARMEEVMSAIRQSIENPAAGIIASSLLVDVLEPGSKKTDADVTRYFDRYGISNTIKDKYNQWVHSKKSEDLTADVLEVIQGVLRHRHNEVNDKAWTALDSTAAAAKVDPSAPKVQKAFWGGYSDERWVKWGPKAGKRAGTWTKMSRTQRQEAKRRELTE
jgi:hypothetical protein